MQSSRGSATPTIFRTSRLCWQRSFRKIGGATREKMLRHAVGQYIAHYHEERDHQSLENRIIEAGEEVGRTEGEIVCDERLGGMLRYYRRAA